MAADSPPPAELACYVCVNVNCARAGSEALYEALAQKLAGTHVQVRTQLCFGACWSGPNVVVFPGGECYARVQPEDVDVLVKSILRDLGLGF
jgi:NADH:ubiquinone oxidoreductase subunit E